jgi:hypothetical protein
MVSTGWQKRQKVETTTPDFRPICLLKLLPWSRFATCHSIRQAQFWFPKSMKSGVWKPPVLRSSFSGEREASASRYRSHIQPI